MLTAEQIRAARGLLGWTARTLAERAGLHIATIHRIERFDGPVQGQINSLRRIEQALTRAGVEFIPGDGMENRGPGVRLNSAGGPFEAVDGRRRAPPNGQ